MDQPCMRTKTTFYFSQSLQCRPPGFGKSKNEVARFAATHLFIFLMSSLRWKIKQGLIGWRCGAEIFGLLKGRERWCHGTHDAQITAAPLIHIRVTGVQLDLRAEPLWKTPWDEAGTWTPTKTTPLAVALRPCLSRTRLIIYRAVSVNALIAIN